MIEMPSGVALLAIGAGLFFLLVLIWGAVAGLSFWPRLLVRLVAAAALIIFPLAFVAANQLETSGAGATVGGAPGGVMGGERADYKTAAPEIRAPSRPGGCPEGPPCPRDDAGEFPLPSAAPAPSVEPDARVAKDSSSPSLDDPAENPAMPAPPAKELAAPETPAASPDPAAGGAPARSARSRAAESGPSQPEEAWSVVPIFYGTDRAVEANPARLAYNSDRARRLETGRALVTVPKAHEVPNVERPWAIVVPFTDIVLLEGREDPKFHFTIKDILSLSKPEFLRLVQERMGTATRFKDHAFVFVHGYNTSFDNALYRTAQIAYDMKFDSAPFVYSWPSGGRIANYTYDRASADQSKRFMREFLEIVCKESGAKNVSVIAHSMGNEPLLDVLKDLKNAAPPGFVISQLILAAPDVDRDVFADLVRSFDGLAKSVTLYAASNDRALQVSRNIWGVPRAGDVPFDGPVLVSGVDTIDVTAASTDALSLNHSGYATKQALLEDIALLIEKGERPPEKRFPALKPTSSSKGAYWLYEPPPPVQ